MIISYDVMFEAKENQIFKLFFPKKYTFLLPNIYKVPEPVIFFNAAPAPLKKGRLRLWLPSLGIQEYFDFDLVTI